MAWEWGTITSATPAVALLNVVEGYLQSTGWTLVDTWVSSPYRYRVWRRNDATYPFHIFLMVNDQSGGNGATMAVALFEGYNVATKRAIRPAPQDQYTAPAADGSYGGGTEYALNNATALYTISNSFPTSGFTYLVRVTTRDLLIVTWAGGNNYLHVWIGEFLPLLPSDPYPIAILSIASGGVGRRGSVTRHLGPQVPGGTYQGSFWAYLDTSTWGVWGNPTDLMSFPNGKIGLLPARISVQMCESSSSGGTATLSPPRGKLPDVLYSTSSGWTAGDRLLVGGVEQYFVTVGAASLGVKEV